MPAELLPTEYGGKAGDLKDIKRDIIESLYRHRLVWPMKWQNMINYNILLSHREYLMDESRWRLTTADTAKTKKYDQHITGNLKTLCID